MKNASGQRHPGEKQSHRSRISIFKVLFEKLLFLSKICQILFKFAEHLLDFAQILFGRLK